mgnify:CR=1 FL=1
MKVKLYIGEQIPTGVFKKVTRIVIKFGGNPALNDNIIFDIKKNGSIIENVDKTFINGSPGILYSTLGASANESASNLVESLSTYDTDASITYSLSQELNNFGNYDVYIDVLTDAADTITNDVILNIGNQIDILNPEVIAEYEVTELSYEPLDLFDDENIEFTNKLSDIEKLSNVFMDVTQSFTIPANTNNSDLFQHYYNLDIDNTFNANIRALAYIEIDSIPYRYGKLQLESVQTKNNRADNYKVTFYGGTIQLSDLFGDDVIANLDYDETDTNELIKVRDFISRYDFSYNQTTFLDTLNDPTVLSGDVITPLISYTNRDWNYGTNDSTDISTNTGAIKDTELKPALRLIRVIEAIEAKYGISFTRNFLGKAMFQNLFIWLNGGDKKSFFLNFVNPFTVVTPSFGTEEGYAPSVNTTDGTIEIQMLNSSIRADEFIMNLYWPFDANGNLRSFDDSTFVMTVSFIDQRFGREGNVFYSETKSFDTTSLHVFQRNFSAEALGMTLTEPLKFKIRIETNKPLIWNSVQLQTNFSWTPPLNVFTYSYKTVSANEDNLGINVLLPNLKVVDLLQGLMKQFKLIIRPLSGNQFYLNTLDGYYSDGNLLNLNNYVDIQDITYERPLIYRTLIFGYEKTNNVLGKKFRALYDPINDEIGYGDLKAVYKTIENKDELKIDVPFENMLFERMIIDAPNADEGRLTNISIGQSISPNDTYTTFSPNNSKTIFFFNNGLADISETPIKVKFKTGSTQTINSVYIIGNTNDELLDQVTDTINFNAEVDPWHQFTINNSLYLNYWSNWINNIYDLKQRKITVEAELPPRYIQELSLNDVLLFGNQRYRINDMTVNLLNGNTKFTLFKEIYDWNRYSMPFDPNFGPYKFNPNGWYYTDYIDNGNTTTLYGSFTGYNGVSYGRIIQIHPTGEVDLSFNPQGTGFNSNLFAFQILNKQEDGKIIATGDFTSYNGTSANRIIRLNENGSIDTGFTYGTGFNNLTAQSAIDTNGKIVVAGSYSTYSGVTANRIIRLNTDGTIDSTFNSGTGFNNVTNSVVTTSNNGMYVSGYFSQYSGVTANRIIKLTSGGTIDTSFSAGTGLNSSTTQTVGLIGSENDSVFVYGYFTQYSGSTGTTKFSNNRITKLLPNGLKDETFVNGSGFNGGIVLGKRVYNDKLLFGGFFTQYAGQVTNTGSFNYVLVNENGSIYRTIPNDYLNVFNIGGYFYANKSNGNTELIFDETVPTIDRDGIIANAGVKFYGINILKDLEWSATKINLGDNTDWVEVLTPFGNGFGECLIKIQPNTTSNTRHMWIKFQFEDHFRTVLITQNGL